ncbi:MAG: hypothetical protein E6099_17215 [Enterobacter sp.]|uniref:hypothetical protein n=1 Tax=Enterobacter roggenkampii TaxID=1812935 RepID=UPI002019B685|nr:hypothetical protein [Enterobacter roggenkampii]MDH2553462.1 hypothetical protein [Enterobacter roggenkampii]MDU5476875.1 hypothetical protein [Enterobacter sp.]MDU5502346.1 hypothetical protein [Enterobacter sp.]UQQ52187.1 hypothetical protein MUY33_05915 [Enterobacter roggenkampii]
MKKDIWCKKMTKMDDDFLQYDLDWFLSSQEGYLAHFATADQGPIPERIKSSVEDYNFIFDYIYSLEPLSEVYVIEGNLPAFSNDNKRSSYLRSFVEMSSKGLFSYDYEQGGYKLISKPKTPLKYEILPNEVKGVIYVAEREIDL